MKPIKKSIQSPDSTTIGYHQLGQGPGLIILHGTMESAMSHIELAEALCDSFTVYLPDRRGRGLSPFGNIYELQKDLEDLSTLIEYTQSQYLFAVSSGAIIALHLLKQRHSELKAALWEPPLLVDEEKTKKGLDKHNKELAEGDVSGALVTAMRVSKMGPKVLQFMPRFLLKGSTKSIMKKQEANPQPDEVTMRELAPTIRHDFEIVLETTGDLNQFAVVHQKILLIGGDKSPSYLQESNKKLSSILPNHQYVVLQGLDHGGSGTSKWGGDPKFVAKHLKKFFSH